MATKYHYETFDAWCIPCCKNAGLVTIGEKNVSPQSGCDSTGFPKSSHFESKLLMLASKSITSMGYHWSTSGSLFFPPFPGGGKVLRQKPTEQQIQVSKATRLTETAGSFRHCKSTSFFQCRRTQDDPGRTTSTTRIPNQHVQHLWYDIQLYVLKN